MASGLELALWCDLRVAAASAAAYSNNEGAPARPISNSWLSFVSTSPSVTRHRGPTTCTRTHLGASSGGLRNQTASFIRYSASGPRSRKSKEDVSDKEVVHDSVSNAKATCSSRLAARSGRAQRRAAPRRICAAFSPPSTNQSSHVGTERPGASWADRNFKGPSETLGHIGDVKRGDTADTAALERGRVPVGRRGSRGSASTPR